MTKELIKSMKFSLELLNVLGLILPGLMAMKLQDMITTSEERPIHEQVILALIYSYFIYTYQFF